MKVTALIDDELVEDVKKIAKGGTITKSLVIALKEWVSMKRLRKLSEGIKSKPIAFDEDITRKTRTLSRRRI